MGRRQNHPLLAVSSQAAYALSNVGLTIFAASALSPADFGWFSMAIIGYLMIRGPIVAGVGHGAIIGPSATDQDLIARCAVAALRIGGTLSLVALIGAVLTSTAWLVVVAAGFPLMIAFEVIRVAAMGLGRPGLALRGDLVWLVAQMIGAWACWLVIESWSLLIVAGLWVLGGLTALISVTPDLRKTWRPGHTSFAPLNPTLAVDDLLANGLQRAALAAGALVVTAAAVAQTRLAIVPFNIVAVAIASLQPMLLTKLRESAGNAEQVFTIWKRYFALAIALTAGNLAVLLVGFSFFGDALGQNFNAAVDLIWWVALLRVSAAATVVLSSTVKANPAARPRTVLLPRVFHGALSLVLILVCGASVGWMGIAMGLSLGSVGGTFVWIVVARRLLATPAALPSRTHDTPIRSVASAPEQAR